MHATPALAQSYKSPGWRDSDDDYDDNTSELGNQDDDDDDRDDDDDDDDDMTMYIPVINYKWVLIISKW